MCQAERRHLCAFWVETPDQEPQVAERFEARAVGSDPDADWASPGSAMRVPPLAELPLESGTYWAGVAKAARRSRREARDVPAEREAIVVTGLGVLSSVCSGKERKALRKAFRMDRAPGERSWALGLASSNASGCEP